MSLPSVEACREFGDVCEQVFRDMPVSMSAATLAAAEQFVARYREAGWSDLAIGVVLRESLPLSVTDRVVRVSLAVAIARLVT